ncbi:hypothetical protein LCGC14_2489680 [marine sediment metagenome]|uniref:Uncharacterized protein n=1 Tax=marine sediment metagenome TaxID=412755 RepID=A0A0F9B581_9ZZZZ
MTGRRGRPPGVLEAPCGWTSLRDVARRLGLSSEMASVLRQQGNFPLAVWDAGHWIVPDSDVEAEIQRRRDINAGRARRERVTGRARKRLRERME